MTWGPVAVGVAVLTGYLIFALALPARMSVPLFGFSDQDLPQEQPESSSPVPSNDRDGSRQPPARDFIRAERSPTPAPTSPEATSPPPADPTTPPPGVSGFYKIKEAHPDTFIGKVVITNKTHEPQDWVVSLTFSSSVGELRNHWVDGTGQPTVESSGDTHVFTSTTPVPAGSWVVLNFHFDRHGPKITPTTCTVNEVSCGFR